MTVSELISELQKLEPDLEVWVSDGGYVEGATPLTKIETQSAWEAPLDRDEVNLEYVYTDCYEKDEIEKFLKKGYQLINNDEILTKDIVIVKSKID